MWNRLSMADRARLISLGVQNGITDLDTIRNTYNEYQKGGHMSPYSAGAMVDAIYEGAKSVESLGKPSHGYDFTQSEEWADAHGYYPDERGHRDDRVKKPSHPTHPSRGKWNGMNEFQLTDRGMEDPNYVRFGMADGGQDPQAVLTHDGAIVLPEFTVTPNGNYIHNSYDNLNILYSKGGRVNKFDDGGGTKDRLITTGNEWVDLGASFVPFVGSAMDIEEAIREPTLGNIGWAALSVASDFLGGSLIRGAIKGAKKGKQAIEAIEAAEKAAKKYERAKHAATVNPTKGTSRILRRTYKEAKAAEATRRALAPTRKGRTFRNRKPVARPTVPMDNTNIINAKTVYGTDAVLNGIQEAVKKK